MILSRFTSCGTGQFTKPILLACLAMLTVSLILNSLILAGCTSSSPALRKFYLVSLEYNQESKKSSLITDLDKILSDDDGEKGTFASIRIGYRGVCVQTTPENKKGDDDKKDDERDKKDDKDDDKKDKDEDSDEKSWHCAPQGRDMFSNLAGDPLELVKVADLYKDKISFATPLFAATILLAITFFMVLVNCVPFFPIPPVTRKIAAATASLGSLILLGSMVLQQVTSGAMHNLVGLLGMKAVLGHVGKANVGFGWTAFATAFVAAVGTAAITIAEVAVEKVHAKGEAYIERGVDKATGGRFNVTDIEGLAEKSVRHKSTAKKGISLATSLMSKSRA